MRALRAPKWILALPFVFLFALFGCGDNSGDKYFNEKYNIRLDFPVSKVIQIVGPVKKDSTVSATLLTIQIEDTSDEIETEGWEIAHRQKKSATVLFYKTNIAPPALPEGVSSAQNVDDIILTAIDDERNETAHLLVKYATDKSPLIVRLFLFARKSSIENALK